MISGRIMMDRVNAPARREKPHPSALTKNSMPNRPYTMEGMPDSVSVVSRITSTNLFPFPAYSTRKMAEKMPKGMAMSSDKSVMITVLMRAGTTDAFSEEYSREAGVRNYEKDLDKVLRKLSLKVIEKTADEGTFNIEKKDLEKYLGQPRFDLESKVVADVPGTAIGLAWTSLGGDVLLIEAEAVPGHEDFKLTGQLGDVMKESCNIALSTVKHECYLRGLDPAWFKKNSVHLHIPEGATPKDGPSAGITLTVALASLVSGSPVKSSYAMTGEVSLRGALMPIGGLAEKLMAAERAGVREVFIPEENTDDLKDVAEATRNNLKITPVHLVTDVLKNVAIL